MSFNFFETVPVEALANLSNLKFLNLGSNKIMVRILNDSCQNETKISQSVSLLSH